MFHLRLNCSSSKVDVYDKKHRKDRLEPLIKSKLPPDVERRGRLGKT